MRKLLLVMVCCMVVCGFAYRFGDTKWEDAKITAMENLYQGISEMMLPQIHLYQYDNKTLLCHDVEQVLMPVVSSFRSSASRSSDLQGIEDQNVEEDGLDSEEAANQENSNIESEYANQVGQGNTTDSQTVGEINETKENPETEETIAQVQTDSGKQLVKQQEVNRIKLQDFDYLRQKFYQVDNTTSIGSSQLDVTKLLGKDLTLSEFADGPQILIYHTHSQEGYADSKQGDANTSVLELGAELSRLLTEKYGIQVLHHTGQYDVPDHAKAYANALPNLEQVLRENPSIEVVIDLHRDGVPATTHLVTEINGKPTAQIMFFNGLSRTTTQGDLAYLPNPYIEDNLAFSFQAQLAATEYYPGFTRKIYLKGYRYNMHLLAKCMLVEVGAQTNTFAEAKNAMEPLADILAMVLKKE